MGTTVLYCIRQKICSRKTKNIIFIYHRRTLQVDKIPVFIRTQMAVE